MSNLIDERDRRTKNRKKRKEAFDKAIDLASVVSKDNLYRFAVSENNGTVRLLDEGAIVTGQGNLDLYIMKGTIEKFLNGANRHLDNITDEYVGTINIGHLDFATNPDSIVGSWTKKDLHLTDNGDGRHGLDVDLHINEEHPRIIALKVQGIEVGPSVEMMLHFNADASKENDAYMVDEIFIYDFAIVGECGNVGSSNTISLKGGEIMFGKKNFEVDEEIKDEETTDEVEEEITDEALESTEESAEEETEEEDNEDTEETDDEEVEDEESEDEESDDEEVEDDEVAGTTEALSVVGKLMARVEKLESDIEGLKEENAKLKSSNKRKDKKLKALKDADREFTEKFKGLSVSLGLTKEEEGETEGEVTESRYASGDGIGE